jgi:hypothetical protein
MYRPSEQTQGRAPSVLAIAVLALLLAGATLALTAIPAAAGGCTFVAAIDPGPDDESGFTASDHQPASWTLRTSRAGVTVAPCESGPFAG